MNLINCDVLIIGAGLAGKLTAILLYKKYEGKLNIKIITKSDKNNSSLAQGGVAISIDKEDVESHINDTMLAGKSQNYYENVKNIISNSYKCIDILSSIGFEFEKESGEYLKRLEGGHSKNRVYFNTDKTGFEIMKSIDKFIVTTNIEIINNQIPIKLIKEENKCIGAISHDLTNNYLQLFEAENVIIASGGVSGLFNKRTGIESNIGEGLALAYEIGCKLSDLHYLQFHPTAFFNEMDNHTFLITEAIRGEGAKLINEDGEYFLKGRLANEELAPRDILSEEIYKEIYLNKKKVYLDCRSINNVDVKFPNIYNYFIKLNIDITKDLIPISPAAHYLCGGIDIDTNCNTNIDNLYAIGEVANSGLNGANRLASNSLMEIIVLSENISNALSFKFKKSFNFNFQIKNYFIYNVDDKFIETLLSDFNKFFNVVKNIPELEKILLTIKSLKKINILISEDIDIKRISNDFIIKNIEQILLNLLR